MGGVAKQNVQRAKHTAGDSKNAGEEQQWIQHAPFSYAVASRDTVAPLATGSPRHREAPHPLSQTRSRLQGEPKADEKVPQDCRRARCYRSPATRALRSHKAGKSITFVAYRHKKFARFCNVLEWTIHTDDGICVCRCGGSPRRVKAGPECSPHERSDMRECVGDCSRMSLRSSGLRADGKHCER